MSLSEELDEVSRQIILAIGDKGAKKISDLEDSVDASRQTIWNRVGVLIAKGYLQEKRDKFPPTRYLSLSTKANDVLRAQRALAYAESAEALGLMFRANLERGEYLFNDRIILAMSYMLLLVVEKLTAGYTRGKLVEIHQKALARCEPVRKLLQELEPKSLADTGQHIGTITKDATDHGKRLRAALAISDLNLVKKGPSKKFLDTKVDGQIADYYIEAGELFKKMYVELARQSIREFTSLSKLS